MLRLLSVLLLVIGSAHAAPLTEREAEGFITVLEEMKVYADENEDVDFDIDLDMEDDPAGAMDMLLSEDGKIVFMSSLAERLAGHPEAGQPFRASVKRNGFSSMESFGEAGDRFMAAFMRSEMSKGELKDMREAANMSDAELQYVPAKMRSMLKRMSSLADNLDAVPDSDLAMVKKLKPRLEALSEEE
ncbi:hypothetical protein [Parvularcula maris]|uniref:Uncharacterized protein n=1 Tax=Parvularcula maris TaxID=2965077 RepID=A0A9X2L813_9PROT|nr:hypothetical protein [Parvularcula maris]MCQ8184810.1 hypothetical protein [Parvularcula maris]